MRTYLLILCFAFLLSCNTKEKTPLNDYDRALAWYQMGDFEKSKDIISSMKEGDIGYSEAQSLNEELEQTIVERDSVDAAQKHQKRKAETVARLEDYNSNLIYQAGKSEWESANYLIDDAEMMDRIISDLMISGAVFKDDDKVFEDIKQLQTKAKKAHVKHFPIMRKKYSDILARELWRENIEVGVKGTGNTTIEFVGGIFANNANIEDFQKTIREALKTIRYKRVNYKFTKYDDDYTSYTIESKKDGD